MSKCFIPTHVYGVTQRNKTSSVVEEVIEQVRTLGYGVLPSGYSNEQLHALSNEFDRVRANYSNQYGEAELLRVNEHNTVRALLTQGNDSFVELALHAELLKVVGGLISGTFLLNQQNGIINPAQDEYNQGAWHRDLPYQHFVSSTPLAINALFCLDEFTIENGATYVLPASHKSETFPSENYVKQHAVQLCAPSGSFVILDCMLFHSGGYNRSPVDRRAINHVFTIPYFRQQINLPSNLSHIELGSEARRILGFSNDEVRTVSEYIESRLEKSKFS